jgi:AraC-like DNA-binding protein
MMEPLVRARTLQGFGALVSDLGEQPEAILERAGLDIGVLSRTDEWIAFRSVLIAYESAALATHCADFGIRLSGRRDLSFLGPLVLIFKYSSDLEHGLLSCANYIAAHTTGYVPVLKVKGSTASWQLSMADTLRAHADQWIEESLLTAIKFVRILLGARYVPLAVHCQHAKIEGTDYEKYFGAMPKFKAPFDGIILNREDLKARNPIDDQQVHRFLLDYLDSRVLRADEDLSAAVRSLLVKLIPTGKFSINVVADQLCVHSRTLQRRLKVAGLSYAELLDECRARMARDNLLTSNLPMGNLAYMLGYADQSAFNHAFRRWYGMTPRQWCAKHREWRTTGTQWRSNVHPA